MSAETRVDPEDGVAYTHDELLAYYKGKYNKAAVKTYWEDTCKPVKANGKAKAKAKARGKANGKAEPKDRAKTAKAKDNGRPRRAAVVVDPYSSGKYLLIELKKRKVPIICVRSSLKLSQQFLRSHEANSLFFSEMLEFEEYDGVPALVEKLKTLPYEIVAVFGGSEPGVELADHIGNALNLATVNPLELLEARKDKAEMQECLRRHGVPAAEQFKSGKLEELLDWASKRNDWPLVAKPTGGAGSDGVYFCKCAEDLTLAHKQIIGALNPTGKTNKELALQEFLVGDEYIVDTVSYEGKHLCVAMWVYTKRKGLPWDERAIISSQNQLLDPSGEKQDTLVDYVFKVLDCVGLKYGPCHTEVMFTPRGPILVEVNARLHGLQGPRLIELATGISKATYAADTLLSRGNLFHKLYQEGRPGRYLYPRLKHCVQLVLCCGAEGYLKNSIQDTIAALNLPSIIEILPAVEKGQFISRSRDLPTSSGSVLMVHESMEQIKEDTRKIREVEESGELYAVYEEPPVGSPVLSPARRRACSNMSEEALEPRIRLDSLEKMDELWASMNSPVLEADAEDGRETEIVITVF